MTLRMERETTEFIFVGVTGQTPQGVVELAIMDPGDRPTGDDWVTAILVDGMHELMPDAVSSGVNGDYYIALLIGPYLDNEVNPEPGDYQIWVRLTDQVERPVRIAPEALEVA